jgi:hypothetical protein
MTDENSLLFHLSYSCGWGHHRPVSGKKVSHYSENHFFIESVFCLRNIFIADTP